MRLTISQLEALYWTATLGSVQKAADQLNMAQPTISLRLSTLRDDLKVELFRREGRGLRLTPDGERLYLHAETILEERRAIYAGFSDPGRIHGTVRVGVFEAFALMCLPQLQNTLLDLHPDLKLDIAVSTSYELEQDVRERKLDMAFLVDALDESHLHLEVLGTQDTTWVASPAFRLPKRITPADLANVPILTSPQPSAMYRQISDWFGKSNIEPRKITTCTSVMVINHMVSVGAAAAPLPIKLVEPYIRNGTVQALESAPPLRRTRVVCAHRLGINSRLIKTITRKAATITAEVGLLR